MKKINYTLAVLFIIIVHFAAAQNIGDLDGIYYQAVALDDETREMVGVDMESKPLFNREIGVRFTITKGLDGSVQWEETHVTTTDKYGLFTLIIGKGSVTSSAYDRLLDIPWIDADQFLRIEISTKNNGNYKLVSNQRFMSVPYAFYTDDIADDAIRTEKILNETILTEDIADDAITTEKILNETIITEDIADGAITTEKILNETIISEDIADGAVRTEEILDETILTKDIANDAITTEKILNEEIVAEDIHTGAVTSDEILDETIQNVDIADKTINLETKVSHILPVKNGGTGMDASGIANGQILVGDETNSDFQLTNIKAGTGIEITNTAGGIEIASPPVGVDSDGSFTIPVGSNGVITKNKAWYSPNSLKISSSPDKPIVMGDIFLASADSDLKGCILSTYLQSIDGGGKANVQVIIFNPQSIDVQLAPTMTFKFLLVK